MALHFVNVYHKKTLEILICQIEINENGKKISNDVVSAFHLPSVL